MLPVPLLVVVSADTNTQLTVHFELRTTPCDIVGESALLSSMNFQPAHDNCCFFYETQYFLLSVYFCLSLFNLT